MSRGFSSIYTDFEETWAFVDARLQELGVDEDVPVTTAVASIFRAADLIRGHMERAVLAESELSFTEFTVLWVLWMWGPQEARYVADRAGISPGTLTGVVTTLERRKLVRRDPHPDDKRSVIVSLTPAGTELISEVFPLLSAEERRVTSHLTRAEINEVTAHLTNVLRTTVELE